jgi:hypothetical protein
MVDERKIRLKGDLYTVLGANTPFLGAETALLATHYRELEFSLKMQRKRLALLTAHVF